MNIWNYLSALGHITEPKQHNNEIIRLLIQWSSVQVPVLGYHTLNILKELRVSHSLVLLDLNEDGHSSVLNRSS